jgi:uncharacterized protein
MKQVFPIFTTVLTSALVFLLLSIALPYRPASAYPSTSAAQGSTASLPGQTTQAACDASRSIHVSGTAVVNVTPDRALIQLGVQSNGVTPSAVEKSNSAAIEAIIRAVRAMGVEGKDIATDLYIIEPVYQNYDSLNIKGYRINNIIAITLRDVSKTSQVIATALTAGANQVINVDLYTSELRKYRDQAREMAMIAAQEKAQAVAQAAGTEPGCVLTITENSWSSYNGWWSGINHNQNQWTQNVVQNIAPNAGSGSGDEPISLGMIAVRAEISASYGLK